MGLLKLLPYQEKARDKVITRLLNYGVAYLVGELRTGKTIVSIHSAHRVARSVLFVTRKKAMQSIESDFSLCGLEFLDFDIINYERLEKVTGQYDLVIFDEAHCMGAFPKPSKRTAFAKKKFSQCKIIFLSGTPTPESFSQLYHQFWVAGSKSPWAKWPTFYKWANQFVNIQRIYIKMGLMIRDYKDAKPEVVTAFNKYKVTVTQKEAGFNGVIDEQIHTILLPKQCREVLKQIKKDKLSERLKIVADSGSKLMRTIHQISSGTFINSEGDRIVLSDFKVKYIQKHFTGKIAIFYVYIAEGDMLKEAFPNWTADPEEFNSSKNRPFICQIQSGQEGVNLKTADHLIFFNISFSATSYWQGRARSQSRTGGDKLVHWLFSDVGMEKRVYEVVQGKKNFTSRHFNERDYFSI